MDLKKMSDSDSDRESISSSSNESKIGLGEQFYINNNHSTKKSKQHKERFLNFDDCIHTNFNYEPLRSLLVSQSNAKKNYKNFEFSTQEDLVPTTLGELIPEDKICENDSGNMNILQYDVRST